MYKWSDIFSDFFAKGSRWKFLTTMVMMFTIYSPRKQVVSKNRYLIPACNLISIYLFVLLEIGVFPTLLNSFVTTSSFASVSKSRLINVPTMTTSVTFTGMQQVLNPMEEAKIQDPSKMESPQQLEHPFCQLPGDPSLILTTNVDLGSAKLDVMKGELQIAFPFSFWEAIYDIAETLRLTLSFLSTVRKNSIVQSNGATYR
jgi:hypothetical protein